MYLHSLLLMCITNEGTYIQSFARLHSAVRDPVLSHGLSGLGETLPGHGHRRGAAGPGGAGVAPVILAHGEGGLRAGLSSGLPHTAPYQGAHISMVAISPASRTWALRAAASPTGL